MLSLLHLVLLAISLVQARRVPGTNFGKPGQNATYDYVVVGGGTAGLAIASRLAEHYSVAVVEAGTFVPTVNGNGSVIPALAPQQSLSLVPGQNAPLMDWDLVTTPQQGLENKETIRYGYGKGFGGSSMRNFMAFHRPSNGSLHMWALAAGDPSYEFEHFVKFYEKSVAVTKADTKTRFANATPNDPLTFFSATGGPLKASWPKYATPLGTQVLKGFEQVGIRKRAGFNSGGLLGADYVMFSIDPKTGYRESSADSFLESALETTGIQIYSQTLGKKIIFDKDNRARALLAEAGGVDFTLTAAKEIIVSAGVWKSPQLLMLSGIGPKDVLEAHGIPVLVNLPGVGQNLQDHPAVTVANRVGLQTNSRLSFDMAFNNRQLEDFRKDGTGLYSAPGSVIGFDKLPARLRSSLSDGARSKIDLYPEDWPELEMIVFEDSPGHTLDGLNYGSIVTALLKPLSRGNVTLGSADPGDNPIVNPNWLADPSDQEVMVAGFKRAREIWHALSDITLGPEFLPGSNVTTDDEILAWVKGEGFGFSYHAASTCVMGKPGSVDAVVDPRGLVYGVKGLRVCDASVLPFLPPVHPSATVYALAEKFAQDIIQQQDIR